MLFEYGQGAIEHLSAKDPELAEVIEQIGIIERPLDDDLFPSVVHHIIAPSRPQEEARIGGSGEDARSRLRDLCGKAVMQRRIGVWLGKTFPRGIMQVQMECGTHASSGFPR